MRISDWSSDVCSSDLSARLRPYDRLAESVFRYDSRPTQAISSSARSCSGYNVRFGFQKWKDVPSLRCRATRTFSITVKCGKVDEIWKERTMPSSAMSADRKSTRLNSSH